jgi:hypothetical protein
MKASSSELLMQNFNEIFIELDPFKRAALLAESYTEDCLWIHPGGRIVGREGITNVTTFTLCDIPRLSLPPILRLAARICSCPTFQQDL